MEFLIQAAIAMAPMVIMMLLLRKVILIVIGRLIDYCISRERKPSNTSDQFLGFFIWGWIFFAFVLGLFSDRNLWQQMTTTFGAISLAVCSLPNIIEAFLGYNSPLKVLLVKILLVPLVFAGLILELIFGEGSSKTDTNSDGSETTYTKHLPPVIFQEELELGRVYSASDLQFYEDQNGNRYRVKFGVTVFFSNTSYSLKRLYNINAPLPSWISWLYGKNKPMVQIPANEGEMEQ